MILGFDGADPTLLNRWLAEGHLPVLKKIIDNGAYGKLRSVPNMGSPASWTSFATGKNPGKHGIFSFTERDFSSYRYKFVNGSYRKAETFWEILCGDRTGCIVNVPMSYPVEKINGCMIAGFDAPGTDSAGMCHPQGLINEMNEANGPYRIIRDVGNLLRKGGDWGEAAEDLLGFMDMRTRHVNYLMDKFDWEVFCVVFGETDHSQHFYWKFLDSSHPQYDEEEYAKYGDTILRIYKKMDDIVGQLVAKNPDATLLIVSDHGGGMNSRGGQLVPDWLNRLGLLSFAENTISSPKKLVNKAISQAANTAYRIANKRLSTEMKFKFIRRVPMLREKIEAARRLGEIDWQTSKAFSDGIQDDIWINLKGRDPFGVVGPEDYDQICDFICEELRSATDAMTGKPIVSKIFRRKDVYKGDYVDNAPDISILWNQAAVINGIKTKHADQVEPHNWTWEADIFTGGHSMDGIVIASGPAVAEGRTINGANMIDIAPTILYHFGVEIPEDFDGHVIEDMFQKEYFKNNPPNYGNAARETAEKESKEIYSDEDNELIEQRLRDLGYL